MKNTIFFQALPSCHLHHHPTNIYAILRNTHSWKFAKNSAHFPKKKKPAWGAIVHFSTFINFLWCLFSSVNQKTQLNGAVQGTWINILKLTACEKRCQSARSSWLASRAKQKNTQIYRVRFPHELWSIFPSFARLQGDGKFPRAPSGRFIKLCIFCVINFDWSILGKRGRAWKSWTGNEFCLANWAIEWKVISLFKSVADFFLRWESSSSKVLIMMRAVKKAHVPFFLDWITKWFNFVGNHGMFFKHYLRLVNCF